MYVYSCFSFKNLDVNLRKTCTTSSYSKYWPSEAKIFSHLSVNSWILYQKDCISLVTKNESSEFLIPCADVNRIPVSSAPTGKTGSQKDNIWVIRRVRQSFTAAAFQTVFNPT